MVYDVPSPFFCCLLSKAVFGNMQASCRPHAMDVLLVAKRPSVLDLSVAANRPYAIELVHMANRPYAIDLVHMANQPHAMDLLPVANRPFAPKAVFRFTVFHCFFIICEGFFSFTQTKNGGIV
jgi:hypothetical protein